ncbi:M10 family metallopeptidase C-terminal domain-containing protein [Limibacillus halophilus]|uniref:Ca2+-binding RTX toxin-like protein n=1 Tax=Limibacillus halophilus TaxID=1579333 RepID=A0A839SUF3_9PROT|nr:M10 family metallopeptidase C-terminal domain-containing protein [Limibacillus halophilus]MBB3064563.1 Ca2+-binding RTX toxin-like protein [Limibacillus halophilus]
MAFTGNIDGAPTGNPWLDSLIAGGAWSDGDGGTVSITYYLQSGNDPFNVFPSTGKVWDSYEIAGIELAFSLWEAVANIDFVENGGSANSDIWYWVTDNQGASGTLGWHEIPGFDVGEPLYGVFNYQGTGWTELGLAQGGYGFVTYIHEIGHGLGLAHPHDGGPAADGTVFPGVSSPFGDYGLYDLNQGVFTTMSYNTGFETRFPFHSNLNYGYEGTPMALDIAAVQAIYGANTTYASGSDIYTLPTVNASGTFWAAIWDTGGFDTITANGTNLNVVIDLRPAPLSGENAGGYVSAAQGIVGGFTIAANVLIEGAEGGSGADSLVGNGADNLLVGNNGNDMLFGLTGNDDLYGGIGLDTIHSDSGNDLLSGGDGNDNLYAYSGDDLIMGGGGNDFIDGGSGIDTAIFEGNIAEYSIAGSGNTLTVTDVLDGSDGTDTLVWVEFLQFNDTTVAASDYQGSNSIALASYTPPASLSRMDASFGDDDALQALV